MVEALIALGSNVGERERHFADAIRRLAACGEVLRTSSLYETAPMYVEDQPPFLNGALILQTALGPWPLLEALKTIEREVGRETRARNGPREIDLDLIAYGGLRYTFEDPGTGRKLVVPHPRAAERRFVLAPAADVAPECLLPGFGTLRELLAQTESQAEGVCLKEDAAISLQGL